MRTILFSARCWGNRGFAPCLRSNTSRVSITGMSEDPEPRLGMSSIPTSTRDRILTFIQRHISLVGNGVCGFFFAAAFGCFLAVWFAGADMWLTVPVLSLGWVFAGIGWWSASNLSQTARTSWIAISAAVFLVEWGLLKIHLARSPPAANSISLIVENGFPFILSDHGGTWGRFEVVNNDEHHSITCKAQIQKMSKSGAELPNTRFMNLLAGDETILGSDTRLSKRLGPKDHVFFNIVVIYPNNKGKMAIASDQVNYLNDVPLYGEGEYKFEILVTGDDCGPVTKSLFVRYDGTDGLSFRKSKGD